MTLLADARRRVRHGQLASWLPAGLEPAAHLPPVLVPLPAATAGAQSRPQGSPSHSSLPSLHASSQTSPQAALPTPGQFSSVHAAASPAYRSAAPDAALSCSVHWAASADDVRDAQRLRYRVFVDDLGARLTPTPGTPAGLDADRFDPFCDHLLVRAPAESPDRRGAVVGTYRVLRPEAARRAGGFYTDTEFDLARLRSLRPRAVELGRSCVHPAWRSGAVIMALWSALAQYMQQHRLDTMIGCASMSVADGGDNARQLWQRLRGRYLVAPHWQVTPHSPLPLDAWQRPAPVALLSERAAGLPPNTPPLIKGYLRCGARLLGPPALDAAFNTADLPMMLRLDDLAPRYRRHLLGR